MKRKMKNDVRIPTFGFAARRPPTVSLYRVHGTCALSSVAYYLSRLSQSCCTAYIHIPFV